MAGPKTTSEKIRAERERIADGGEALNSERRTVRDIDGSLYVNPTDYGARTFDLEAGDTVEVHTKADGIHIKPSDE